MTEVPVPLFALAGPGRRPPACAAGRPCRPIGAAPARLAARDASWPRRANCSPRPASPACPVRAVARHAGVNVAMINYYFGTKDKLVDAVLTQELQLLLRERDRRARQRTRRPKQVLVRVPVAHPGLSAARPASAAPDPAGGVDRAGPLPAPDPLPGRAQRAGCQSRAGEIWFPRRRRLGACRRCRRARCCCT